MSLFKEELVKFKEKIQTRKLRLQRIMTRDLSKKQDHIETFSRLN